MQGARRSQALTRPHQTAPAPSRPSSPGNVGGEAELAAVRAAAADIVAACEGLADFVAAVAQRHGAAALEQQQQQQQQPAGKQAETAAVPQRLGDALLAAVRQMEALEWLVPPMLQPR